jgi:predicted small metal-binding protein
MAADTFCNISSTDCAFSTSGNENKEIRKIVKVLIIHLIAI